MSCHGTGKIDGIQDMNKCRAGTMSSRSSKMVSGHRVFHDEDPGPLKCQMPEDRKLVK